MADNLMGYTLWLMLHDKTFMQENAINASLFPRGSARYIAELALNTWQNNQELLDDTVLDMAVETETQAMGRNGVDTASVVTAYLDMDGYEIKPTALRDARRRCREWLEKRALEHQLARAQRSLSQGDAPAARAHLSGVPNVGRRATASTHISLAEPNILRKTKVPGGIPTGFKALDKEWDGGAHPGELGMVAGSTGTGKSMALCFMSASAFWAGANVLYYTFELSPQQIQERITTAILQKGLAQITDDWDVELQRAAVNSYGLNIPPAADIDIRNEPHTWPEIFADLEQYRRDWGKLPDCLMLDSADDVAPLVPRDGEPAELKQTFVMLRDYAAANQIRIWSTAQLTRDAVEKGFVNLRMIGSAFAKAQKSHYVLGFAQTDAQRNDVGGPKMMLYVLKDTSFGTGHSSLEVKTSFGFGKNGYPGYDVLGTSGLPSVATSGGFDDDPV